MQISPNLHFQVILQFDLRWPLTLICDLLTAWTYEGSHIISINQVWFQSDFNFSIEANFTFSAHLTTWPHMNFDLNMWPLTSSTNEGFHVISINQVWFESDFDFSIEANFAFSAYLTSCPYMTFDLGMWPLTSTTNEGSHLISINQVWFESDFDFSIEANFAFSAYLTFDLGMLPLTSSTNEGSHVAPMIKIKLKSVKVCGNHRQMLTFFHNRQQQHHHQQTTTSGDKVIPTCLSC